MQMIGEVYSTPSGNHDKVFMIFVFLDALTFESFKTMLSLLKMWEAGAMARHEPRIMSSTLSKCRLVQSCATLELLPQSTLQGLTKKETVA